jgi:hypothetical protein
MVPATSLIECHEMINFGVSDDEWMLFDTPSAVFDLWSRFQDAFYRLRKLSSTKRTSNCEVDFETQYHEASIAGLPQATITPIRISLPA